MRLILNISTKKADSAFISNAQKDLILSYIKLILKVFPEWGRSWRCNVSSHLSSQSNKQSLSKATSM